jgi:hypothetical protein
MRHLLGVLVVTFAGCAVQSQNVNHADQERRHAANMEEASSLGYVVSNVGGQTKFCPTMGSTGSHIITCETEGEFERARLWEWHGFDAPCCVMSGRSSQSGTNGY